MPCVVWAEESKTGLGFEIELSYGNVPTTSQCATAWQSSCNGSAKLWTFEVKGSKLPKRKYHTLICLHPAGEILYGHLYVCITVMPRKRIGHAQQAKFLLRNQSTFLSSRSLHFSKNQNLHVKWVYIYISVVDLIFLFWNVCNCSVRKWFTGSIVLQMNMYHHFERTHFR